MNQNCKDGDQKIWLFLNFYIPSSRQWKKYGSKTCISKKQEKCKKCRFYGVSWLIKWVFERKLFLNFWHVPKCLIQNLIRCITFFWNLVHHKMPNLNSSLLERHKKCKTLFSRRNIIQNMIFWAETFFQFLTRFNFLN